MTTENTVRRLWVDRGVNLAMLWCGALLAGAGLTLKFRLGPEQPRGTTVLGMNWQAWSQLHYYLGVSMLVLFSLHFWRHRRWWWGVLCRQKSVAFILVGLVALLLLLGPLLSPA